jgi:hypothetical protein
VFIRDDRPSVKWLVRGNLGYDAEVHADLSGTDPQEIVGRRVTYRVITHRRQGVDPSIPFDQLTAGDDGQRVRALVSLMPAPWHRGQITTHPAGATGETSTDRPGMEGYEYLAAVGAAELAYELLTREPGTPTHARLADVADHLLRAADWVQQAIRPDHQVDRAAFSHTRARGAVHAAIERHGLPRVSADPEAWATIAQDARLILEVAADLLTDGDHDSTAAGQGQRRPNPPAAITDQTPIADTAPQGDNQPSAPTDGEPFSSASIADPEPPAPITFKQLCAEHGWKIGVAFAAVHRSGHFPRALAADQLTGDQARRAAAWLEQQPGFTAPATQRAS